MANKFFFSLLGTGSSIVTASDITAAFGSDIDFWIEPRLGGMLKAGGSAAAVGDKVATATDLSSGGGTLTQSDVSKQMTLIESSYTGTLALVNDQTGGYMHSNTWNGWNNLGGQCWLAVYKPTTTLNPGKLISASSTQGFGIDRGDYILLGTSDPGRGYILATETFGGQIIVAVHDGSQTGNANRLQLHLNNQQITLGNFSTTIPATYTSAGPGISIGGESGDGEWLRGEVYCLIHIRRAPTADERTLLWQYARDNCFATPAAQSDWIGEGDSRWKGYTVALDPDFNKSINYKLAQILPNGGNAYDYNQTIIGMIDLTKKWNTYNYGQEGDRIITHIVPQQAALLKRRDQQKQRQILSLLAGVNDIADDTSAATLHAALVSYGQASQAAGFTFIAMTDPGYGGETGAQTTQRLAYNNLIRANWETYADAMYDLAADLTDPNDGVNFDGSLVHFTEVGNAVAAQGLYDAADLAGVL